MKAFLLAAGHGTRLRPLTLKMPKCLIPINGIPLISFWFDLFRRYGIDDVFINLSCSPEQVEAYIATYASDLRIRISYEKRVLGSLGTLIHNIDFFPDGEDIFIFYSDNLTNVNLDKFRQFHQTHSYPFTMGLFRASNPSSCGIATLDNNDVITDFTEKPHNPVSDLANAGIYLTSKEVIKFLPASFNKDIQDIGFDLLPRLVNHMKGYRIPEFLLDIGTIPNLRKAEIILRDSPNLFPLGTIC